MMIYLIYEEKEGEKNRAFIEKFEREGRRCGLSFLFVAKEEYRKKPLPALVLNRTRDAKVSCWYEERKVPVFHSSTTVEYGNDKWKTYLLMKEYLNERSFPGEGCFLPGLADTYLLPEISVNYLRNLLRQKEWENRKEFVLKSVDGHGGTEVYLFTKEQVFATKGENFTFDGVREKKSYLIQEKISGFSEDIRVYIMGNRIYHAVKRKGEHDFRSNYSLGGTARSYVLTESERVLAESVVSFFRSRGMELFLAGLDFIVAEDGSLFFNELEEMVGCRMLYAHSDKDVVRDYVSWISSFLS